MSSSIKKNSILNVIKTCSSIAFPLITFPYASRILLPDNIGKVNFAQSFVSYFALIAALGLSTHAIRECSLLRNDKEKLEIEASQLFSINIITTVLSLIALAVTVLIWRDVSNYRILIAIESITILATTLGADWINSAMEDFKYITIRTISFQVISMICLFSFVRTPEDYYRYAIISVLSAAGANVVNIWYRKKYCRIRFTLNIDWKKHLTPIAFLFVMQLSITIFNNADVTMIGLIKNDYEVGLYSTAHKLIRIVSLVVQSLSFVIIPRLTVLFDKNDFESANKLLRKVLGFNLTLGLPCVVGVICIAEEIIFFFGGNEFSGATPVIRVLILSLLFSLYGGSFLGNAILIPMKKEKYYMTICIITAFANILLNAFLIPSLGAVGASISTAFNGLLIMLLLMIKTDKRIKINNMFSLFFKPILGCVGIIICCIIFGNIANVYLRTGLCVISSGIVYLIIELLLKNDMMIEMMNMVLLKLK